MLRGLRSKALLLLLGSQSLPPTVGGVDSANHAMILKQVHDFEVALKAMDYLLDDRTEMGTKLLQEEYREHLKEHPSQPAAIFPLALGVMEFIEATLGFEPEVMAKAHKTLSEAESKSLENSKFNTKHLLATSRVYPPGTEFQVTYAELTLLNALLMLLQENNGMVEGAKALFKLRRAYQTLESIYKRTKELEPVFTKNLNKLKKEALVRGGGHNASVSLVDLPGYSPSTSRESSSTSLPQDAKLERDLEKIYLMRKARIQGTNINERENDYNVNLFESSSSINLSSSPPSTRRSQLGLASEFQRRGSPSPSNQNAVFRNTPPSTAPSNVSGNGVAGQISVKDDASSSQAKNHGRLPNGYEESDEDDEDNFSDAFESVQDADNLMVPPPRAFKNIVAVQSDLLSFSLSQAESVSSFESESDANHMYVSTVDEFIHSGVQLCFGILQVVLSLIPPTIGKVLSIVGFKGNREAGLRMLWKTAITTRNIHSELSLLCLLVFYDGPVQFIDNSFQIPGEDLTSTSNVISITSKNTVTDSEIEEILKYPKLYTPQLLLKARSLFPHNALWLLEEGRMLSSNGQLEKATKLMQSFTDDPNTEIQMEQIEALLEFDRAMMYAFQHDFDQAARDFIHLTQINSWSKSLYLFFAGSCYLAKWRMIKLGLVEGIENREKALEEYGDKAERYLRKAPLYVPGHGALAANKKGGIGGGTKQFPFDKFLLRRLGHVEKRQKENPSLSFLNCFGTSPIHELIYFWDGYNRMTERDLNLSMKLLGYSGQVGSDYSINTSELDYSHVKESEEEAMIRYFLQSVSLRLLGKLKEGLSILDSGVLSRYVIQDSPNMPFKFKKLSHSPYLYPTALYEKSVFVWSLRCTSQVFDLQSAVKESKHWIKNAEITSNIGDYELSNRTSMKLKAAADRLEQLDSKLHT